MKKTHHQTVFEFALHLTARAIFGNARWCPMRSVVLEHLRRGRMRSASSAPDGCGSLCGSNTRKKSCDSAERSEVTLIAEAVEIFCSW